MPEEPLQHRDEKTNKIVLVVKRKGRKRIMVKRKGRENILAAIDFQAACHVCGSKAFPPETLQHIIVTQETFTL